jgi:peptidoglycan/xylan/chitin deacetylase (PgdA/CDA1 family)
LIWNYFFGKDENNYLRNFFVEAGNSIDIAMKVKIILSLSALFIIIFSFSNISYGQTEVDTGRTDYSSQEFENMLPSNSCNCIAFRFDDIQNGWLLDVQLEVVNKFREKNIPLTIGIIGNELEGDVANFVKKITNEANSTIETANHGWIHEDFTILDKETQGQLMEKTNKKIFDVIGKSSKIFIPPFNVFNNDTIEAMKENNFTIFSSNVFNSKPPFPLVHSDLYNFPETSTTGIINPELRLFGGLPYTETLKDIQASQNIFGFSVVTLHPQEFSMIENGAYSNQIDKNQIHELELLINEIQKSNLKIVYLSQINENVIESLEHKETESYSEPESQTQIDHPSLQLDVVPSDHSIQKIPEWVRNIFVWYADDQVSEDELLNAIKYLINEKIINLN